MRTAGNIVIPSTFTQNFSICRWSPSFGQPQGAALGLRAAATSAVPSDQQKARQPPQRASAAPSLTLSYGHSVVLLCSRYLILLARYSTVDFPNNNVNFCSPSSTLTRKGRFEQAFGHSKLEKKKVSNLGWKSVKIENSSRTKTLPKENGGFQSNRLRFLSWNLLTFPF